MQNEFECPQYFIVDSRVLRDENLSAFDVVLYSLLCGLANNSKNGCYSSNQYLSEFLNVSIRSVKYSLTRLKKFGYISVTLKNNNTRYIKTIFNLAIDFREKKLKELSQRKKIDIINFDWLNENIEEDLL